MSRTAAAGLSDVHLPPQFTGPRREAEPDPLLTAASWTVRHMRSIWPSRHILYNETITVVLQIHVLNEHGQDS